MFDRFGRANRFAFQFQGGPQAQEGWTPPWQNADWGWHNSGRGPRFFQMRAGRGPFGRGGPFGPDGPFGPENRNRRFFGRGDLKFALLELLRERPMHGYEMMKALEEKSGGFYAPSAGSVYPTLQMLEDRGLVTVSEVEGKKVYSLTEAGKVALEEHQQEAGQHSEFAGPPWHGHEQGRHGIPGMEAMGALRSEAAEVARLFAIAGRVSFHDPEKMKRLREVIERTRKELSDLIYGTETK
jgi:DNA-binding PadR family transcriptional regulator